MKTIFEEQLRKDLIHRIEKINENCLAQWGKMNVYQMLMHCTYWDEWIQGINNNGYKQTLLGKIFGKMALRSMVRDDKPLKKNIPTVEAFRIKKMDCDLEAEKKKWISLIQGYAHYSNPAFIHDFFGKMTRDEIGILAYKHADHHLRQFGKSGG